MHPAYDKVPHEQRRTLEDFRASHYYKTLDVGGVQRLYTVSGPGPRTLVFLPGAFMDADMWFYAVEALENTYRILAMSGSLESFKVEGEIAAALAVMDAEGVDKATLIGLSFGGGVLQCMLQDHPDRVEHAVLSHCSDVRDENIAKLRKMVKFVRLVPGFVFQWLLRRRAKKYPKSSEWADFTRAYFRERLEVVDKKTVLRFVEDVARSDVPQRFDSHDNWPGEILLLSTTDDPISSPRLDALKERYPRAHVEVLAEGGHHTVFLFPDAYLDALASFLRGTMSDAQRKWDA